MPIEESSKDNVLAKVHENPMRAVMDMINGAVDMAQKAEDDAEPFDEKMKRLTSLLKEQQIKSANLDKQIAENLKRIGYEY